MVTFISLYLWLVVDTLPVEVAVDPGVASVEVFLDEKSVGVLNGPPWKLECDFGSTLRPHELLAVARDESGDEMGRAVQLVNLPRSNAEAQIVFEIGASGEAEAVRVVTESGERLQPLAVFVTFDGRPLIRNPGGRFTLPDHDPRQVHIVSAEAHFPGGLTARQDVTIGGTYGSRVATELTAVPVVTDAGVPPTTGDLQGLLEVEGAPVHVAAVERPGARVYVVRDHGAWPVLQGLGRQIDRRARDLSLRTMRQFRTSNDDAAPVDLPIDRDRFHLVIANPTFSRGLMLFPVGQPLDIKRWGLPWLVTHLTNNEAAGRRQRLGEAVAVAGVRAAGDGSPRAVVLVLSRDPVDVGGFEAEAVREYLRGLHVPLFVWSVAGGADDGAWGPVEDISNPGKLVKVSRRLMKDLGQHWVVWVEGRHLPSAIEMSASATLQIAQ